MDKLSAYLKAAVAKVRRDGGLIKDADRNLWIRWLGTNLKVRVAHALADGVDTNQGTRAEEVLALQRAWAHWVLLGPNARHILGEKLGRSQLITWVATRWLLGRAELSRTLIGAEVRKALTALKLLLLLILELLLLLVILEVLVCEWLLSGLLLCLLIGLFLGSLVGLLLIGLFLGSLVGLLISKAFHEV